MRKRKTGHSITSTSNSRAKKYLKLALGIMLLIASVGFYLTPRSAPDRYVIVANTKPHIKIYMLNMIAKQAYIFSIPGDTQMPVSRNLGTLKIKNVYELSKIETESGALLAETIRNNFSLPIYLWSDQGVEDLIEGGGIDRLSTLLKPNASNLSFKERMKLFVFSTSLREFEKSYVELADTSVLEATTLTDGSKGYVLKRNLPESLRTVFALEQDWISEIKINDLSETSSNVQLMIGEIAQVLGARVAQTTSDGVQEDFYCNLTGEGLMAFELAKTLNCELYEKDPEGVFTIEIDLGKHFSL